MQALLPSANQLLPKRLDVELQFGLAPSPISNTIRDKTRVGRADKGSELIIRLRQVQLLYPGFALSLK